MPGDFEEFLSRISFRFMEPGTSVPYMHTTLAAQFHKAEKSGSAGLFQWFLMHIEFLNTILPVEGSAYRRDLRGICMIPRMSTFAIGALINHGVALMDENWAFVNVGVWHGFTFLAGLINNENKRAVGIDDFSKFGGPRTSFLKNFRDYRGPKHHFYEMDYREYFRSIHEGPIGLYFYDGDHSYNNQIEGLKIAEPYLVEGSLILVDDINWDAPRKATLDFVSGSSYHYEFLLDARTAHNFHPTLWNGLIVLRRVG